MVNTCNLGIYHPLCAETYVRFRVPCPLYLILTKIKMNKQILAKFLAKFLHIWFHGNTRGGSRFVTWTDRQGKADRRNLAAFTCKCAKMWIMLQVYRRSYLVTPRPQNPVCSIIPY